jgi:hypothetical protein
MKKVTVPPEGAVVFRPNPQRVSITYSSKPKPRRLAFATKEPAQGYAVGVDKIENAIVVFHGGAAPAPTGGTFSTSHKTLRPPPVRKYPPVSERAAAAQQLPNQNAAFLRRRCSAVDAFMTAPPTSELTRKPR